MELTLGSLFDGIGGFPLAASRYGIKTIWSSEIEPFPIIVTKTRLPEIKHLGDITKINGTSIEPVDIITFGSPCFPAGTLVLTKRGYIPIEEVVRGDMALTHTGKWRKVLRTGCEVKETVLLKGMGHYGLETTAEHPFYAAEKNKKPQWVQAKHMKGLHWSTNTTIETLDIPPLTVKSKKENEPPKMDENFWWFVGRWLADGWIRHGQRSDRPSGETWAQIYVCVGKHRESGILKKLNQTGLKWARFEERTSIKFRANSKSVTRWLLEHFGEYAHEKRIPSWAYTMPNEYKLALMEGYLSADGWKRPNGGTQVTTVSKNLAIGVRLIAVTMGKTVTMYKDRRPTKTTIEGREVKQRDTYMVRVYDSAQRSLAWRSKNHIWGLVRSVTHTGEIKRVYNLEVEEDNSYVVENIIVHNCQDLSVAGKRDGLAGERSGLFMEAIRIIKEMRNKHERTNKCIRPRYAVWENVPGAFSSNKGEDFKTVIEEICRIKDNSLSIPQPPKRKWNRCGCVMGDGFSIAWRTIDAQFWGVPQRRRRIFLVADFGGQSAPEVLFKRQGLSRHLTESGEAREGITADAERGVGKAICNEIAGTLDSCYYKGCGMRQGVEREIVATPKTMLIRCGKEGGGNVPMLAIPTVFNEETITSKTNASNPQPGDPCHTLGATGAGRAICIQGSMIGRADKNGPQGDGINEDVSFTLNTTDRHAVAAIPINTQIATRGNKLGERTGFGIGKDGDPAFTIQAAHGHAVATKVYGICSYASNSMKSDNPHSGVYEAETSRTIDLNGGSPACNQGGMAIVQVLNDQGGSQMDISENVVGTLRAEMHGNIPTVCAGFNGYKSVTGSIQYQEESAATLEANMPGNVMFTPCNFGQEGQGYKENKVTNTLDAVSGSKQTQLVAQPYQETVGALCARDHKGVGNQYVNEGKCIVESKYSVRRLTPLECERLQGFPDYWTDIPGQTEASQQELEFWRDVWLTWDRTQAEDPEEVKPRTDKRILRWLKNPTSDSAQYKALGNSVAVPCPEYVLEGIAEVLKREKE